MITIQNLHLLESLPKTLTYMLLFYFLVKVLDFATGLLKTWKGVSPYQSAVMRDGIIRWIGELIGIIFVLAIDFILGLNFYLTGFTVGLFIYKEGGSIVENLKMLEVNLPGIVQDKLNTFDKGKDDKNDSSKTNAR
ncbi:phage holin family protein [Schinkia azotoformans]|uniref:Holin n=1 Tax=Schinkia azotoformans LMG 9581 TaxID=1131731 RepID=K6C8U5_SCHAZ|nr:phage holin family protein [Schinkia azotoformans]EKN67515.1 holin [Schinkia azotoformans LMG 9581]MEC1637324.1 phage holin family protein [Schinkia azotoformans]MEC1943728.1 phage holin family protein [Schinkia azotoformans]